MDKVTNQLTINIPSGSFIDEGDGVVSFPEGLTITDGTVQRNGTRYDMESLDVSKYGHQLTGDHEDKLGSLIGETIGVVKNNGKVLVKKIRYAIKENAYARLAYDLLVGGFSKNFSTETIGPLPDERSGIYYNAELVGLSQVVTQNNYNAHVNQFNEVVHNSLEQSKKDGLDVSGIEDKVLNHVKDENKMEEKNQKIETETPETETNKVEEVNNTITESLELEAGSYQAVKNDDGSFTVTVDTEKVSEQPSTETTPVETEEKPEVIETTEPTEDKTEEVKKENTVEATAENGTYIEKVTKTTVTESEYIPSEQEKADDAAREARWADEAAKEASPEVVVIVTDAINEVEETVENQKETDKKEEKMDEKDKTVENSVTLTEEQLQSVIANALKPFAQSLSDIQEAQKNAFDASAKEPEFKKEETTEVAKNDFSTMDWQDRYNKQVEAAWNYVKLGNIEAGNVLREINAVNLEGLKKAGIARNAMTLDDLGNFVIPEEMYSQIVGYRNDYTGILNATEWREATSLEFAYLRRVGDIDMRNVAIGVDLGDGVDGTDDERLKPISEYSAVPVRTQLEELAAVTVVATSATRFAAVDLLADAAQGYRNDYDRKRAQLVIAKLEDAIDQTGFSVAYNPSTDVDALQTWLEAITEISDTTLNGTLIFNARTFAELKSRAIGAGVNGPLSEILTTGDMPSVWGYKFVVVPNDLMPSLGGSESISHLVDGVAKVINHAVIFADLTTFTGRTSGGLQYDVSNSASYENGGIVKSAYQRNELVLRGSFFRGGAVKDINVVAGIRQGNSANVS